MDDFSRCLCTIRVLESPFSTRCVRTGCLPIPLPSLRRFGDLYERWSHVKWKVLSQLSSRVRLCSTCWFQVWHLLFSTTIVNSIEFTFCWMFNTIYNVIFLKYTGSTVMTSNIGSVLKAAFHPYGNNLCFVLNLVLSFSVPHLTWYDIF